MFEVHAAVAGAKRVFPPDAAQEGRVLAQAVEINVLRAAMTPSVDIIE